MTHTLCELYFVCDDSEGGLAVDCIGRATYGCRNTISNNNHNGGKFERGGVGGSGSGGGPRSDIDWAPGGNVGSIMVVWRVGEARWSYDWRRRDVCGGSLVCE